MNNIDFDQLNGRLRKRLNQLRHHQDPTERLRILKRYLSYFVRFVQAGRNFESSFDEHLRLVVAFLNDRREKPLEEQTLGTIVKTLCVICCITKVSYQTVMIALYGLLDIFERISCKETRSVIEFCGNHFKKLVAQFKRFGYFVIQRKLLELVYISSLSFDNSKDRKNFVLEMGSIIGGPWENLLEWKSIAAETDVRNFINNLQNRYPFFAAYSVSIDNCQIGEYRMMKPNDSIALWLDINFKPATVRFAGHVTLVRETACLEAGVELEIDLRKVANIDWIEENDKYLLSIEYDEITIKPEGFNFPLKGSVVFSVSHSFDHEYFKKEIIPEIQSNLKIECKEDFEQANTTYLESLLNVSVFESVVSGPTSSHNFDQSPRLRENRAAIVQHRNVRCQMLDTISSAGSNKENVKPRSSVADVGVAVNQDVQRLRVFQPLQQDCNRNRDLKQKLSGKRNQEVLDYESSTNNGKKRKLFDKHTLEPSALNDSVDSQMQRTKYIERKLVNTVKPIQTLEVEPMITVDPAQNVSEVLNESSTTEMSTEEFEKSLQTFINNNGIFGLAQQKKLDKKLEKNIRKINEMVDRTTKKFFKREPATNNPYDFIDSESNRETTKKKTTRKGTNSNSKKKNKMQANTSTKTAKNVANQSMYNRSSKNQLELQHQTAPKPANNVIPKRQSLPRSKKPTLIVDFPSDSENEAVEIGNTFQNLDVSYIPLETKSNSRNSAVKQPFAKSTPVENIKTKKRLFNQTYRANEELQKINEHQGELTQPAKMQRAPLLEIETTKGGSSSILIRRDYRKQQLPTALEQRVSALIEQEKNQAHSNVSSSPSFQSDETRISINIPKSSMEQSKSENLLHQTRVIGESIPDSLQVHPSPTSSDRNQTKTNPSAVSNFNLSYAKGRYTLKKFISDKIEQAVLTDKNARAYFDSSLANGCNESILSDEIRVGCDNAVPPSSFRDDSRCDLHSGVLINLISPERRSAGSANPKPTTASSDVKSITGPNMCSSDHNLTQTDGVDNQAKEQDTILDNNLFNSTPMLEKIMLEQFEAKIHQELDPSLSEFEIKVKKLVKMLTSFEPNLAELNLENINKKFEEIMELENKLDESHSELANLCIETLERSKKATVTAKKLSQYAESKANYYKEQANSARQEMPDIVNDCIKNVWNEQVRVRLDQVEILMKKMLM